MVMRKKLLKNWLDNHPQDVTEEDFFVFFKNSLDELHDVRSDFLKEKTDLLNLGFIKEKEGLFSITPEGVAFAFASDKKINHTEALLLEKKLVDKINAWNYVAHKNNLPGIAFALVFGSLAEAPHKNEFGDIDCALMWRRKNTPEPKEKPSAPSLCGAHAVFAHLDENSTAWDIEDLVENWLSAEHISLHSMDQLLSLSEMGGVKAWYPVLEDRIFNLSAQDGVRQDEQDVLKSIEESRRAPVSKASCAP